jgi:hypothetical protein
MCASTSAQKFKIEHESDLGYGKGYALINNEFYRVLNKLALLPYGLFLISHSQEKEIETRTGKLTRIIPTLPDKARKIVLGHGRHDPLLRPRTDERRRRQTGRTAASCAPSPTPLRGRRPHRDGFPR